MNALDLPIGTTLRAMVDADEYTVFSSSLAESMVGSKTKDGWEIVAAENEGTKRIWFLAKRTSEGAG